jgi:proline dehydrogenase
LPPICFFLKKKELPFSRTNNGLSQILVILHSISSIIPLLTYMTDHLTINFEDTGIAFAHQSDASLRKTYYLFKLMNYNQLIGPGTWLVKKSLAWGLPVKKLIRTTLFDHFCGGENIRDCQQTIDRLAAFRIGTILDYAVEGASTEAGFDATTEEIIRTIHQAALSPHIPFSVFKPTGVMPTPVLEKLQAGKALSASEQAAFSRASERIDRICREAWEKKVRIFMDAEETWLQSPIDQLAREMMQRYNKEAVIVYNTYQMYCHQKLAQLQQDLQAAMAGGYWLGVKLVRGAYMEKERARAAKMGYPDPIQPSKAATDRDYDLALEHCLAHKQQVALCSGSHNEQSNYLLVSLMNRYNIRPDDPHVYFAQLYGMSDHISYNLSKAGYCVAKYVPYGPVEAVLPYLFRRAEENTSIAGQSGREFVLLSREIRRRKK